MNDVVNAAMELAFNPKANHQCYNIVDDSESTQGTISNILADIFNIKVDYWGIAVSKLAKVQFVFCALHPLLTSSLSGWQINMSAVVDEINDKHLGPWAELCQTDKTENTPLTPYMDEELLHYNHLNMSNEKLKSSGYNLRVPIMTTEKIEEVVLSYWISYMQYAFLQFLSFADNQRFYRTETTAKIDDALMFRKYSITETQLSIFQ